MHKKVLFSVCQQQWILCKSANLIFIQNGVISVTASLLKCRFAAQNTPPFILSWWGSNGSLQFFSISVLKIHLKHQKNSKMSVNDMKFIRFLDLFLFFSKKTEQRKLLSPRFRYWVWNESRYFRQTFYTKNF